MPTTSMRRGSRRFTSSSGDSLSALAPAIASATERSADDSATRTSQRANAARRSVASGPSAMTSTVTGFNRSSLYDRVQDRGRERYALSGELQGLKNLLLLTS